MLSHVKTRNDHGMARMNGQAWKRKQARVCRMRLLAGESRETPRPLTSAPTLLAEYLLARTYAWVCAHVSVTLMARRKKNDYYANNHSAVKFRPRRLAISDVRRKSSNLVQISFNTFFVWDLKGISHFCIEMFIILSSFFFFLKIVVTKKGNFLIVICCDFWTEKVDLGEKNISLEFNL